MAATADNRRVYRVTELKSVDAGLFPAIPSANMNVPTMIAAARHSGPAL
jgi:hypothetical protein